MSTLYVQEQGAMVRKRDNQILIIKQGKTLSEVPLAKLDQVVLMGRGVQISTALLVTLTATLVFTFAIAFASCSPSGRPDQRRPGLFS